MLSVSSERAFNLVLLVTFLCFAVKEAGRDFTYLIVVLVGLGVTGDPPTLNIPTLQRIKCDFCCNFYISWLCLFPPTGGLLYVVFQELFSSSSPNKIYGKAFNKVKLDPEVRVGLPLVKVQFFLFSITGYLKHSYQGNVM